jgi:hypothetical protein
MTRHASVMSIVCEGVQMKKYLGTCAAAAIVLTAITTAPAAAQEPGSTGLVMGSGSTIGLSIKAGSSVTVRPSVAFVRSTSENGGLADGDRTTTGWAPGVSVLFQVKSWDATKLYISPQWTYTRSTSSDDGENETKSTGHSLAAMLGAQHNLSNRFAVFGEVGLGRTSTDATYFEGTVGNKSTAWTTRSTIGAILFF